MSFEVMKLIPCRNKGPGQRGSDQLEKHGGHKIKKGPIRK